MSSTDKEEQTHLSATISEISRRSSPSAKAFFAALDAKQKGAHHNNNDNRTTSSFVQKRLNVLGWRNRYSQSEEYPVTIDDNNIKFHVKQIQRGEIDGSYGTGATVWPASLVLCHYLAKHKQALIVDKNIVDLGTGTAVTSIAAIMLGAKRVVATDGMSSVVELAKSNVESALQETKMWTNTENPNVEVKEYWWGSGTIAEKFDVVLVADCVLPKLYPIAPLVDGIDELLSNDPHNPSLAVLSYEHRYYPEYDPRDRFRQLCENKGLVVECIDASEHDPVYSVEDIEIWHVYRQHK